MATDLPFRFDPVAHRYTLVGSDEELPHITGLLEADGLNQNARWMTAESKVRGSAVHRLAADYDREALTDVIGSWSYYKGWLHAYAKAMSEIPHRWDFIEMPFVHPYHRFGGRPDRGGLAYGAVAVLDLKSGGAEDGHPIQTALQAILIAPHLNLPPHRIERYALYLKQNGHYGLEHHPRRRDFDRAYRIIRDYCRSSAA